MVVFAGNVIGVSFFKAARDSILVIDPDGMLSFPIVLQRFEVIARRNAQALQPDRRINHKESSARVGGKLHRAYPSSRLAIFAIPDILRSPPLKALDHGESSLQSIPAPLIRASVTRD